MNTNYEKVRDFGFGLIAGLSLGMIGIGIVGNYDETQYQRLERNTIPYNVKVNESHKSGIRTIVVESKYRTNVFLSDGTNTLMPIYQFKSLKQKEFQEKEKELEDTINEAISDSLGRKR